MKKIISFFVFFLFFIPSILSQSKIDKWNIENITSFSVYENKIDRVEMIWFGDRDDIDTIFYFIKSINLENLEIQIDKQEILKNWIYKIEQKKYPDQIILCKGYISIGKTFFKTEESVLEEFKKLINSCN